MRHVRADGASQTESDAAAVLAHAAATLGDPMTWTAPPRERGVALATIGAVWASTPNGRRFAR